MDMVRNAFILFRLSLSAMSTSLILLSASLKNVDLPSLHQIDKMESFFLAKTLKFLFLLFDPSSDIDIMSKVRRLLLVTDVSYLSQVYSMLFC